MVFHARPPETIEISKDKPGSVEEEDKSVHEPRWKSFLAGLLDLEQTRGFAGDLDNSTMGDSVEACQSTIQSSKPETTFGRRFVVCCGFSEDEYTGGTEWLTRRLKRHGLEGRSTIELRRGEGTELCDICRTTIA